jgi:hypothetical protein
MIHERFRFILFDCLFSINSSIPSGVRSPGALRETNLSPSEKRGGSGGFGLPVWLAEQEVEPKDAED